MPKVYENVYGTSRAKGNFLASEVGKRLETRDFTPLVDKLGVEETNANGEVVKVIKKGKVCPENTTNAQGIVFEDVYPDAEGHYIGSLMTGGYVWKERLEDEIASAAITTLKALGLYVVEHPETVRPDFGSNQLKKFTVGSAESIGKEVNLSGINDDEINNYCRGFILRNKRETLVFANGGKLSFTETMENKEEFEVIVLGDYVQFENTVIKGICNHAM